MIEVIFVHFWHICYTLKNHEQIWNSSDVRLGVKCTDDRISS